jgi:hypothetical protein
MKRARTVVVVDQRSSSDPAEQCLMEVAAIVSRVLDKDVSLNVQRDTSLMWKAASVHPLQAMETEYQGIVRDAARGVGDPDARKTIESEELGRFFLFDVGALKLLGVPKGADYEGVLFPIMSDRLRSAQRELRRAVQDIEAEADGPGVRRRLLEVDHAAFQVLQAFFTIPGSWRWRGDAPLLSHAWEQLQGVPQLIREAATWNNLNPVCVRLDAAMKDLERALPGVASVQMFHVIEGFYLFRLLVRYRIDAAEVVTPDDIARTSGELTKLLTNKQPWLSAWLRDKIIALSDLVKSVDRTGNTLFFLKGGRAIKYLEGQPDAGENDWDTQIVINPYLPPAVWYELFLRINNAVLLALESYKMELYVLLHHYAPTFKRSLDATLAALPAQAPPDQAGDDAPDPMEAPEIPAEEVIGAAAPAAHRANCKSELIDIGLPRYDTIEAREQWDQLRGDILVYPADGMPYPGYLYYINEYVMLVREAFTGESPSQAKAPKRIGRLYEILTLPAQGLADAIAAELAHIPPQLLPLSVAAVNSEADQAVKSVLIVLLRQFSQAYDLASEPGLAAAFDTYFSANLANAANLAPYPPSLQEAITALRRKDAWPDKYTLLANAVGYCQWLSGQMQAHFQARAAYMVEKWPAILDFLRTLYASAVFSPREELEVQLAATESLGARLQADYTSFARRAALEPFDVAALKLYAKNPAADPAIVLELVSPIVTRYVTGHASTFTLVAPPGALLMYWTAQPSLPPLAPYSPLAISISVARTVEGWPLLSFIWGNPVLGLRDLVREYQRRCAATEEFGTRAVLRATAAAVTEILTRAENPEPPNPAVVEMGQAAAHHLMISSQDYVNGPGADYPPSYYPANGYRIVMTANRPQLRAALTLPPSNADRTLDLLVINQGHGDWGLFSDDRWTAADITTYLVAPLLQSGVRAYNIVLDFCLSASLLSVFVPLCADPGKVVSSVYSTTGVVVDTSLWTSIQAALAARDRVTLATALDQRLHTIATATTGSANMNGIVSSSEQAIALHLAQYPNDRDAISIIRYLQRIAVALQAPGAALAQVYFDLADLKQQPLPWGNVGYGERPILEIVPNAADRFTNDTLAQVTAAFTARVVAILTGANYPIGIAPAALNGVPLFGNGVPNLWDMLVAQRPELLALAPGLPRCPTPFSMFNAQTKQLDVDAALTTQPIAVPVANLLRQLEPSAPDDAVRMLTELQRSGILNYLNGVPNYDQ